MDAISIAAASGMRARMESLDMLANNIANASTPGYKADREFYNLYLSPEASGGPDSSPSTLPVIEQHWTDFSQGTLAETGNSLDLALTGKAFFAVDGPNGVLLTRNGSFHLSAGGELQTQEGYRVRDSNGGPVRIDPSLPVTVSEDGTVLQRGAPVAQIQIADSVPELLKGSAGYFHLADASKLRRAGPASAVHQGRLESSNVGAAESSVKLVSVMRQFDMLLRAVHLGADMNRKAVEEVAKVNS